MGFKLPNGSTFDIAATYGTAVNVTAITSASPAVASAAGHAFVDGDVLEVTSGWRRLNGRAVRVADPATGTFELEGIDTTKTTIYPVGAGAGSVRAVETWAQLSQVTEVATNGGEQQFATFGFLEEDEDRQLPTTKSPSSLTITVADDPSLEFVAVCEEADMDKQPRIVRLNLPNGSSILYNAYISITETPSLTRNELMTRTVTLSLASRVTRYTA